MRSTSSSAKSPGTFSSASAGRQHSTSAPGCHDARTSATLGRIIRMPLTGVNDLGVLGSLSPGISGSTFSSPMTALWKSGKTARSFTGPCCQCPAAHSAGSTPGDHELHKRETDTSGR